MTIRWISRACEFVVWLIVYLGSGWLFSLLVAAMFRASESCSTIQGRLILVSMGLCMTAFLFLLIGWAAVEAIHSRSKAGSTSFRKQVLITQFRRDVRLALALGAMICAPAFTTAFFLSVESWLNAVMFLGTCVFIALILVMPCRLIRAIVHSGAEESPWRDS